MPSSLTRVTFLGDTHVGGEAQAVLDERGHGWAFDGIRDLLADSDLVVANHEGPLTDRTRPEGKLDIGRKRYWYRADAASTRALIGAGIRVVSLANNHVLDFGVEGLDDTMAALDEAGIAHCGAGMNRADARRPAIVEVNGIRLGFLSVMQRYDIYVSERQYASRSNPGVYRLRLDRVRRDLERLRATVDLPVVLAHWGRNYRRRNPRQQRLAHAVCAAGARLVVGHHPHIPQPLEFVDDALVCYSLGNGPVGSPGRFHSGRPPYGMVVTFELDRSVAVRRIQVSLIHVDNAVVGFQPRPATGAEARRLLRKLLPGNLEWIDDGGSFAADIPSGPEPFDRRRELVQPGTPHRDVAPLVTLDQPL